MRKENFVIKQVKISEWALLLKISKETFSATFGHLNTKENFDKYMAENLTEACVKKELANTDSTFYFYYLENKLAGYTKLNENKAQTETGLENAIEVERFYLYKAFQGKGLGRKMMEHVFQIARKKNRSRIWLGVWEKNKSAIKFYEKLGFAEFGSHDFYLGDDLQTDLMMGIKMDLKT
ncbi:MAG: GNAT family N-acetyltransferase [Bacteroidota bacterium]